MSTRIGINCLFLIPNRVGGTEYHTRSYIQTLQEMDKKNFYTIFCNYENFNTIAVTNPNWTKVLCPVKATNKFWRLIYEQFFFPFMVAKHRCNILHSFGYFGPIWTACKRIITLHDINWRDCPEDFSFFERFVLKILIESNILTSNVIVSTSEFSQRRFVQHFPLQQKKNRLILSGIEDEFLQLLKTAKQEKQEKYFLSVSAFYPHKNVLELLSTWEKYVSTHKGMKLVLVGKNGREEKAVLQAVQQIPSVEYFAKIPFVRLVSLYKHAEGFLFNSTYEGFGYPVYEALAARIPVYVKKKDLFEKSVQSYLSSIDDMHQVKKLPHLPNGDLPTYRNSCRKLLQIYKDIREEKTWAT